ncbi:hypothetical protein ABBQ32_010419 [Trebouxia sp. C0010 RCD-2024]
MNQVHTTGANGLAHAPRPCIVRSHTSQAQVHKHSQSNHTQKFLASQPPATKFATHLCQRDATQDLLSARAAAGATATTSQSLASIELNTIINTQGLIQPLIPSGSEAAVFAVYNDRKQLQYVGFSKDLYNSLRTLLGRRPDKAFFYKATHLPTLDQKQMVDIRTAWFEECGGPPPGNKLALERTAWQSPVDAGAISERGKLQAAEEQLKALQAQIVQRGCKEDFQPDPELMKNGKVDFLPAKAMTPEELAEQQKRIAELAKATRVVEFEVDGSPAQYELFFVHSYPTNGGMMYDLTITYEEQETRHRIILGREYYEDFGMQPENVVAMVFTFLLQKKEPRHTEGLMLSSQFPINYFSISELDQVFPDFQELYASTGKRLEGDGKFWRFNKLHDYGYKGEDAQALSNMFKLKEEADEEVASTA